MPEPLRAITVRQPWAWAIAAGHKPVENRSWTTSHRGPLAIHAGKTLDREALSHPQIRHAIDSYYGDKPRPPWPGPWESDVGGVVAVAEVTGFCVRGLCACGPWAVAGAVHWQLARVQPLARLVPCRGAQGLWTVPADVALQVREAVDA